MANPQLENGYMKLAVEIMEALAHYRIKGNAWQCLCVILRKTYGWDKKDDHIGYEQFMKATGFSKSNLKENLKWLEDRNIIIIDKKFNKKGFMYTFNKNYETWKGYCKDSTVLNLQYTEPSVPTVLNLHQKSTEPSSKEYCKDSTTIYKQHISTNTINRKKKINDETKKFIEEGKKAQKEKILPNYFTPITIDLWNRYVEVRRSKHFVCHKESLKGLIEQLNKFHTKGYNIDEIINKSLIAGYREFFEPNINNNLNKNVIKSSIATKEEFERAMKNVNTVNNPK